MLYTHIYRKEHCFFIPYALIIDITDDTMVELIPNMLF